jgi:hypothetical protein
MFTLWGASSNYVIWHTLKLFDRLNCESKVKIMEKQGIKARSLAHSALGERGVLEFQDGSRKNDKQLINHVDLYKPNNMLVSA